MKTCMPFASFVGSMGTPQIMARKIRRELVDLSRMLEPAMTLKRRKGEVLMIGLSGNKLLTNHVPLSARNQRPILSALG